MLQSRFDHHLHGLRQRELYLAVALIEDTRVQLVLLLQDIRVQCQPQGLLPLEEKLSPFPVKGAERIIRLYLISLEITHDDEIHLSPIIFFDDILRLQTQDMIQCLSIDCDVFEFTRYFIHLIYQFSFHNYVEMHLFDVVDALDI